MAIINPVKRNVLFICLILAPTFQLIGDSLWVSHEFKYSWSIWREASYVFFIPVGFLLAKLLERKSIYWAIAACALYVIGCFGSAAMMPLFRLGAFYPIEGHNQFPAVVQSVLDKNGFGITLFIPGLCLPVSLIVFGVGFLRHRILNALLSSSFIIAGVLFWLGNAMEVDPILVANDVWLLIIFCWLGYSIRNSKTSPQ